MLCMLEGVSGRPATVLGIVGPIDRWCQLHSEVMLMSSKGPMHIHLWHYTNACQSVLTTKH